MKDKIKIIGAVIIFAVSLIIISVIVNINNDTTKKSQIKKSDTSITNEIAIIEVDGNNFESEVINSNKKVLIDFYATWCGPCKILSPILEEVATENKNIKLVKIDVDKNEDLAYKYGITAMPTIIVIENGKELKRSIGAISKNKVLELLKN